ncbi:MAG: hypothetical protein QME60_05310 [Verrucomicrobiota bacterium]|nr:hypothetical protein [Verrucomicrobiota bacterium]
MKRLDGWMSGMIAVSLCIGVAGLVVAGEANAAAGAKQRGNNLAAKRAAAGEKAATAREKAKERRATLQEKGEARINKRQDNQTKRIEHGNSTRVTSRPTRSPSSRTSSSQSPIWRPRFCPRQTDQGRVR